MGLFENIFGKKTTEIKADSYFKALTAYSPVFHSWNGALYESELVRSAIDARARHIAKLKVEVIGSARPTLATKLKVKPNNFQTWYQFMYRLSTILDMHNTAFIVPVVDKYGDTVGMFPVLPTKCEILQTKEGTPVLRYEFADRKTGACYMSECGIMTKFQYKSDFFGERNTALNPTMDLIDMQGQGIKEAIKNGATYRFMARTNNFTKTEDLKKERQRFSDENFSKEAGAGGLLLFPNTYSDIQQIKTSPYTINPEERKMIQDNVYNLYAVNEDIIQSKAIGDAWNSFYESVVETFAIQFSEVTTNMYFSEREQAFGSKLIATSNRLQYMSNSDKLKVSAQMADRGLMTINEIRDIWNLAPVEDGDVRTVRGEYYTLGEEETETEDKTENE
jgi:hypothetical protein